MHFQHTIEILQTWFIFSIPRKLKKNKKNKNTNHLNWPKMPILRWFSCSQDNKLFCRQKNKTKPNNNFSPCSNDAHYLDCLFCLCLSCVQPNADKLLLFCFVFLHKKDILMIIRVSQWFQLIYRYLIRTWVSQVRFHCLFRGITRSSYENPSSKVLGFFYLLCCHYCCSYYHTWTL